MYDAQKVSTITEVRSKFASVIIYTQNTEILTRLMFSVFSNICEPNFALLQNTVIALSRCCDTVIDLPAAGPFTILDCHQSDIKFYHLKVDLAIKIMTILQSNQKQQI